MGEEAQKGEAKIEYQYVYGPNDVGSRFLLPLNFITHVRSFQTHFYHERRLDSE